MGLLDIFKGKLVDPTAYPGVHGGGDIITTTVDAVVKWGRKSLDLADALRHRLLRHRVHGPDRLPLRPRPLRGRGPALLAPAGRPDVRGRHDRGQGSADPEDHLRPDARAQVGHLHGRLRVAAAASTARTTSCRGSTRSSPWTSTCPAARPSPEALIAAVMKIQERIRRASRRKAPQGAHRLGAPGDGASTAARAGRPGPRTTPSGRRRACRPRGVLSLRVLPADAEDGPPWLAPTEDAAAAAPPVGDDNPAARVLRPSAGRRASSAVDDFRGDLAITVDRSAWVEAAHAAARPPRARLQALPRPLRRRLARRERDDRYEVVLHAVLGLARSTTSA